MCIYNECLCQGCPCQVLFRQKDQHAFLGVWNTDPTRKKARPLGLSMDVERGGCLLTGQWFEHHFVRLMIQDLMPVEHQVPTAG